MSNNTVTFVTKVKLEGKTITEKIEKDVSSLQAKFDAQILKDSNRYCPMQTGMLQKSAIVHSKIGNGVLSWVTPYAHEMYYNTRFTHAHSRNPQAHAKWFEVAKSARLSEWLRLINAER